MISFLFSHSIESSGIGMSMMSLEEMKEAGMHDGERLQGAADTGRSAVVRTCSYTTRLGGEGNISCTSLRCCHVGVKRSRISVGQSY